MSAGGGRNPGPHSQNYKLFSLSLLVDGPPRTGPNPEPVDRRLRGPAGGHLRRGQAQTAPHRPKGKKGAPGVVAGRRPCQLNLDRDSGAGPCGGRTPAPRRTNGRRPPIVPRNLRSLSLLGGRSPHRPTRPRERSPRIHWLPHCTAPATVLHGRRSSRYGSGSGHSPAASPPPGHRPPRPAGGPAPHPRPPPPTRGRRGRNRPRARPGQSSPLQVRRGAAAEMAGRLVRSVKGAAAHGAGERGGGGVTRESLVWAR